MVLIYKIKSAYYAIYHTLNNRVKHKFRMSVYVFDDEGFIYQEKTASKTPVNVTKLRAMFRSNPSINRPKYVGNKIERKRDIARNHARFKTKKDGCSK